jgi:predicted XRE-type DNA-binding protein
VQRSATKSGDLVSIVRPKPTGSPICAALVGDDTVIVVLFTLKLVIPAAVELSGTKSGDLVGHVRLNPMGSPICASLVRDDTLFFSVYKLKAMESQKFTSVWDAIEDTPQDAANMKARSELMLAIREIVDGWNVTQADASERIGVTQPRMNDLLRGRIDKFSLDALLNLARGAGLSVSLNISKIAA